MQKRAETVGEREKKLLTIFPRNGQVCMHKCVHPGNAHNSREMLCLKKRVLQFQFSSTWGKVSVNFFFSYLKLQR